MADRRASGRIAMAVHGGAFNIAPDEVDPVRLGCRAALEIGLEVLRGGGSSLDAVEAAVRSLESNGEFDAGAGAFLDEDGEVSLDAGMMDGATLRTGSVAAVQGVAHVVTLARRVLESEYAVIVGPGAHRFCGTPRRRDVRSGDADPPAREGALAFATGGGQAEAGWAAKLFRGYGRRGGGARSGRGSRRCDPRPVAAPASRRAGSAIRRSWDRACSPTTDRPRCPRPVTAS